MVYDTDKPEKIKKILDTMMKDLSLSFVAGDISRFMEPFDLDIVSEYHIRKLFENYCRDGKVIESCDTELISLSMNGEIVCEMAFHIYFRGYDPELLGFRSEMTYSEDSESLKITECKTKVLNRILAFPQDERQAFGAGVIGLIDSMKNTKTEPALSAFNDLMEIARASEEPFDANVYVRNICKSVRYRLSNPEVECGAVIADLLSLRTFVLADFVRDHDEKIALMKLNAVFDSIFRHRSYKEVRHKDKLHFPLKELSLEPMLNMDELFAAFDSGSTDKVEIRCTEIASIYSAVCRVLGLGFERNGILLLPFHYMNYIKLSDDVFVIDVNQIMKMSTSRICGGYSEVAGIVSPPFFIDQAGYTNMPSPYRARVLEDMIQRIPTYTFPQGLKSVNVLPEESIVDIRRSGNEDTYSFWSRTRRAVFTMSKKYPVSPYTWAKYAHQTLFVQQPQAYAMWSMKSHECAELADRVDGPDSIIDWMATNLKYESVYTSYDRIMTADQVVKHRSGLVHDRALLFYTLMRMKKIAMDGGVVLTDKNAYVVIRNGSTENAIFDMEHLSRVNKIDDEIILAFNERESLCIWQKETRPRPEWLE